MTDLLERLRVALAPRYGVERELGRGGMATVFLASDPKHERRVAIKVLNPDLAAQLGSERFLREIKTAAHLTHPNILTVYDSGEADGLLYYVMPFVDGGSLRERLDRDKTLPLEDSLRIAQEVADALHHAHGQGFIHRDIKPENILFMAGRPVVSDFGIARVLTVAGGENLTQIGMAVGTPAYMSPEQATADPHLDGRSDLYSLGCVLYEMVSGHPPFSGRNPREILARQTLEAVPPLRDGQPNVPVGVDQTVARALAKDPADRFATAREFADALAGRLRAPGGLDAVVAGLGNRRVVFLMAGYVAFGVLAWLTTRMLVGRLDLSPALPGFVVSTLALLLPAAIAVAYIAGNRGVRWRMAHAAGVSANVAAALVALFLLFRGKDLGATTEAVTLTDEQGKSLERVIPKAEFRKRVGLFYLDADPPDSLARNLAYGIPDALQVDLLQDLYIDVRSPGNFRDRLRQAGHRDLTGVPLSLAREIAQEQFRDHFVMGRIATRGAETEVTMSVHRTSTGEQIRQVTVRDADPLAVVDRLSSELRATLGIPERYTRTFTDLPVAELLTRSPKAFLEYVRADRLVTVENDFAGAGAALERAIAADSSFAFAHYTLFLVYVYQSRGAESRRPLEAAVELSYRLPERMRNQVKANYYEMRQEPDKMYAVLKMNAELFPGDVAALGGLMQVQLLRGQQREAIATAKQVLEADPNQQDYLRVIGGIHQGLGEFKEALKYFAQYTRLNPRDRRGLMGTGDVQVALGELGAARESYEQVRLLDPANVEAAMRIASLDLGSGDYDKALTGYQEVLTKARNSRDSAVALGGLTAYFGTRGQIRESIRQRELAWSEAAKSVPPIQIIIQRLQSVGDYVAAGDSARALALLAEYKKQLQPPFDQIVPLGDLRIALALENPAGIDSAASAIEGVIQRVAYGFLRPAVAYARGQASYLRRQYREAITAWEKELELSPQDPSVLRQLGQAWRELKEYGRAEKLLEEARRLQPGDPRTRYELALLEEGRGHNPQALEHVRAALAAWVNAEPAFKWSRRARELAARLERTVDR